MELEFEQELSNLLHKYGMDRGYPDVEARYLIRQLDNYRETQQEVEAAKKEPYDDSRNQSRVGGTTQESGDN